MTARPNLPARRPHQDGWTFVRQMQQHPLSSDDASVWQGRWAELRKRPSMAKEFERLGRDMPAAFLPDAKVTGSH